MSVVSSLNDGFVSAVPGTQKLHKLDKGLSFLPVGHMHTDNEVQDPSDGGNRQFHLPELGVSIPSQAGRVAKLVE